MVYIIRLTAVDNSNIGAGRSIGSRWIVKADVKTGFRIVTVDIIQPYLSAANRQINGIVKLVYVYHLIL